MTPRTISSRGQGQRVLHLGLLLLGAAIGAATGRAEAEPSPPELLQVQLTVGWAGGPAARPLTLSLPLLDGPPSEVEISSNEFMARVKLSSRPGIGGRGATFTVDAELREDREGRNIRHARLRATAPLRRGGPLLLGQANHPTGGALRVDAVVK